MELWSADRVWAHVDQLARDQPGGLIAMDADGTLWGGDVGDDLFHAFMRHGRVEPPAFDVLREQARHHELSDAGSGSDVARRIYAAYLEGRFPEEGMCEIMTWCFAGWTRPEVRAFAQQVVVEGQLPSRLHEEVVGLLERSRKVGIDTLVVSASPIDVVAEAARCIGFAEGNIVAARPRWQGDVMLPDVERPIPFGEGKVRRLQERAGAGRTLYAAFGDNSFDVALLASAKLGVAVRPKPRLRKRAHEVHGLVELAPGAVAGAQ